ncbi:hypothetical protein OGATHE_006728 [Ogataea polymorpha]|uniref:Uncharacterized protein n=1 Tax=Ogataea polymorpha TaxID=460523 RepID=A0A9P8NTB3_9ASCO|nr:hypothetical protein OGATHE_006728 [Ogataea polymorpha]
MFSEVFNFELLDENLLVRSQNLLVRQIDSDLLLFDGKWKMSPNDGAMIDLMPKSLRAHGACSLEEPQPKLSPVTHKIWALVYGSTLSTKSVGTSFPFSSLTNLDSLIFGCAGSSLYTKFLISVNLPVIPAAAAIAGDIKCVLDKAPCLPTKFLLDVEAHLSYGAKMSGFIPRHMEQPASLQTNPAASKILSSPSLSACFFTNPDPGTTMAIFTLSAFLWPLTTLAAALKSSIREFVQDPMNTLSTVMSCNGVLGSRPIYFKAASTPFLVIGSVKFAGSGTLPVMGSAS